MLMACSGNVQQSRSVLSYRFRLQNPAYMDSRGPAYNDTVSATVSDMELCHLDCASVPTRLAARGQKCCRLCQQAFRSPDLALHNVRFWLLYAGSFDARNTAKYRIGAGKTAGASTLQTCNVRERLFAAHAPV